MKRLGPPSFEPHRKQNAYLERHRNQDEIPDFLMEIEAKCRAGTMKAVHMVVETRIQKGSGSL